MDFITSNNTKKTDESENMAASLKDSQAEKPPKKEPQPLIITKTLAEEQRLKLEKLMRNPDKPAAIPERPKEWSPRGPPEFVRDVMGSSAGAGSGEFHVYRHLRRREYQRQDFLDRMSEKQKQDEDYLEKIKENQQAAEDRTAKRRKKREKLKLKKLTAKKAKEESNKPAECDKEEEESSAVRRKKRRRGGESGRMTLRSRASSWGRGDSRRVFAMKASRS